MSLNHNRHWSWWRYKQSNYGVIWVKTTEATAIVLENMAKQFRESDSKMTIIHTKHVWLTIERKIKR